MSIEPIQMHEGQIRCRIEMTLMGHFLYRNVIIYKDGIPEYEQFFAEQLQAAMVQLGKTIMFSKPAINPNDKRRFFIGVDKKTGKWIAPFPLGEGVIELTADYKPTN